jgi:hypothetical protein
MKVTQGQEHSLIAASLKEQLIQMNAESNQKGLKLLECEQALSKISVELESYKLHA